MKLYEIDKAIEQLIADSTDPETGELVIDEDVFNALCEEKEQKIENLLLYIKDLNVFVENLKAEKVNIDERIKKTQKKVDGLTEFVKTILNGEKFRTTKVQVSYRPSTSVVVNDGFVDWAKIYAPQLLRKKETYEPEKEFIKTELNEGSELPFVRLETRVSMKVK